MSRVGVDTLTRRIVARLEKDVQAGVDTLTRRIGVRLEGRAGGEISLILAPITIIL